MPPKPSDEYAAEYGKQVVRYARKVKPPEIAHFAVTNTPEGTPHSTHPTIHEAVEQKRKNFEANGNHGGTISAVYGDGSQRVIFTQVGGGHWHFTPTGRAVNDSQVTKTGRGKTIQAYLAKDDPRFINLGHIRTLAEELRPGNMPRDTGSRVHPEVWKRVAEAADSAYRTEDLTPFAALYDHLHEHYHAGKDKNMGEVMDVFKQYLHSVGIKF